MNSINDKLNKIESIITKDSFSSNKGLGNDIPYYIFDYNPKYELKVRNQVKYLKEKINDKDGYGFKIDEFNLYYIIIDILKKKKYLDKVFDLEEKKGREKTQDAINKLLKISSEDSNLIINYIKENISQNSIVFITGVGQSYPIIRSHDILNNLHHHIDDIPVVMFFPGKYSGYELILFGTIEDNNYYRAFPLID
ncbi:MAG: DUF1788 domain-containing protein [Methanobrevibacter sp.]|jgi:hypothetical protein|nr:DUF1788 domain-containing protein [Candidatus Methanovirga meridionalis]